MLPPVLAVDVGGTKIAVGLVEGPEVVDHHQAPTGGDPWATVTGLIGRLRPGGAEVVGVGCGGPMTARGVSPLNIGAWRDFPLGDRLADGLEDEGGSSRIEVT